MFSCARDDGGGGEGQKKIADEGEIPVDKSCGQWLGPVFISCCQRSVGAEILLHIQAQQQQESSLPVISAPPPPPFPSTREDVEARYRAKPPVYIFFCFDRAPTPLVQRAAGADYCLTNRL